MPSISGSSPLLPLQQSTSTAGSSSVASTPLASRSAGPSIATNPTPAAPGQLDTGAVTQLLQAMVSLVNTLIGGQGGQQAATAGTTGTAPLSFAGSSPAGALGAGACPNCTGPTCVSCNGGGAGLPASGPGVTTPLPGASSAPPAALAQVPGVNDQNLQNSLNAIAQDPEGAKLLERAKANGFSIKVGNTGGANVLGLTDPNTKTITINNGNNIKTLVHELVHAASTNDGNSQTEEGLANVIGKRVESRLTGKALEDPNATFRNTLPNYQSLSANNNIRQTLGSLGITA